MIGYNTPYGIKLNEKNLLERLKGRKQLNKLLNRMTVKEKQQPGRPRTYGTRRGWKRMDHNIYLPKVKAEQLIKTKLVTEIKNSTQHEDYFANKSVTIPDEKWVIARSFYEYQVVAAEYISDKMQAGAHSSYIQMETGLGKTCFGIAVGSILAGPVFVIAPTDKIRKDWIAEFQTVFPNLVVNSYKNLPKKLPKKTKKIEFTAKNSDIVVGVVNTIAKKDEGFFDGYRLVIVDEAHEMHSPTKMDLLWLLQEAEHVLMMSATPEESTHGLDTVVYHFAGAPIYAEKDIPDFDVSSVNFRGRVREINYHGHPDHCEIALTEAGTINVMGTIGNILSDPHRLDLIVAETRQLYDLHNTMSPEQLLEFGLGPRPEDVSCDEFPEGGIRMHSIFIFAELRSYLTTLKEALLKDFKEDDIEIPELEESVILRGGASDEQCTNAKHARIVLTTYGFSRRGVSLTNMSSLIEASPRRNGWRQILGRVIRRGSDQSIIRMIIDIKDKKSPLGNQSTTRRKAYKLKKYPIYTTDYHYDQDLTTVAKIGDEKLTWQP